MHFALFFSSTGKLPDNYFLQRFNLNGRRDLETSCKLKLSVEN
jgi:hypothetical protein